MTAAAVLYVQDLTRMRDFYQRCFGMTAASEDDGFCVLASAGAELSLVRARERVDIADPPRRREESPVKLAFDVESLEGLEPVLAEAGGRLDPLASAWEFRGRRHIDCVDPEGNVVQVRE